MWIPVSEQRLARDVAGFLALLELLELLRLRLAALQAGPDPGHEGDVPAVGQPLEGLDAGCKAACTPRLATIGCDQVELRRLILAALLLPPGYKGD